jgi:hypothetical protein
MATITLEISSSLYEQLRREADERKVTVEQVAQARLARLAVIDGKETNREQAVEVLRAAGMLADLGPEEIERAGQLTMTLEEVQAALAHTEGGLLSELVLELRGPKE